MTRKPEKSPRSSYGFAQLRIVFELRLPEACEVRHPEASSEKHMTPVNNPGRRGMPVTL